MERRNESIRIRVSDVRTAQVEESTQRQSVLELEPLVLFHFFLFFVRFTAFSMWGFQPMPPPPPPPVGSYGHDLGAFRAALFGGMINGRPFLPQLQSYNARYSSSIFPCGEECQVP